MEDELMLYSNESQVYADDETPQLQIDRDQDGVCLEEMENAYRYELWRCLLLLQQIKSQTDELQQALETISQQQVKDMWK